MVWALKSIRARKTEYRVRLRVAFEKKFSLDSSSAEIKLKSLIMAQIERWRHA